IRLIVAELTRNKGFFGRFETDGSSLPSRAGVMARFLPVGLARALPGPFFLPGVAAGDHDNFPHLPGRQAGGFDLNQSHILPARLSHSLSLLDFGPVADAARGLSFFFGRGADQSSGPGVGPGVGAKFSGVSVTSKSMRMPA